MVKEAVADLGLGFGELYGFDSMRGLAMSFEVGLLMHFAKEDAGRQTGIEPTDETVFNQLQELGLIELPADKKDCAPACRQAGLGLSEVCGALPTDKGLVFLQERLAPLE